MPYTLQPQSPSHSPQAFFRSEPVALNLWAGSCLGNNTLEWIESVRSWLIVGTAWKGKRGRKKDSFSGCCFGWTVSYCTNCFGKHACLPTLGSLKSEPFATR